MSKQRLGKGILIVARYLTIGCGFCQLRNIFFGQYFKGRMMKGFNILYVAMWRILSNLDVALRVSVAWIAVIAIVSIIVVLAFSNLAGFLVFVLSIVWIATLFVAGSAIAVGWHRFCLLGEKPQGLFGNADGADIWLYIKASLKVTVISFLVLLPVILVLFLIALPLGSAGNAMLFSILEFIFNVLAGALVAGISLFLPAAALRQRLVWAEIKNLIFTQFGVLLSLSFAYCILSLGIEWVLLNFHVARFPIGFGVDVIALVVFAVICVWFFLMLSVGYISELYGIYFLDDADAGEPALAE